MSHGNILLIITDDVGFGARHRRSAASFRRPTLDRIAANGLRYTNFHSTSLCSPTRAALITGRNHHSVGFGVVSEQSTYALIVPISRHITCSPKSMPNHSRRHNL
jgi:arylsulfatase A-like enzyme